MPNITAHLPKSVYQRMAMQTVIAQNLVDFSKANAASGDTVEVLEIPAGCFVNEVILAVHTTETTVTMLVGDDTDDDQYLTAQTLTDIKADNDAATLDGAVASANTAKFFYADAGNKILLTIGGAAATTAVVSVIAIGTLVAKTNYVEEQAS